ncbi:MAG: hypothetical protein BWX50_01179 [Euryarchaeota archaeon ADurb.Bin009]|nr:MAG: hypothetical protein BWX50_01179 [Euryarchaeota archaeon ADurb.Bin009]
MQSRTASSMLLDVRSASTMMFPITSVPVVVQKICPRRSYSSRSSAVLTRLPSWAIARLSPRYWKLNGWMFSGTFDPAVG